MSEQPSESTLLRNLADSIERLERAIGALPPNDRFVTITVQWHDSTTLPEWLTERVQAQVRRDWSDARGRVLAGLREEVAFARRNLQRLYEATAESDRRLADARREADAVASALFRPMNEAIAAARAEKASSAAEPPQETTP